MLRRLLPVTAILVVAIVAVAIAGFAWRATRTDDGNGKDDAVESRGADAPGTDEGDVRTTSPSTPPTSPPMSATPAPTPAVSDYGDGAGATEAAGPGDPGPPPSAREVALTVDGLGIVDFGAPGTELLTALTAALGPPDEDTGLVDQRQVLGACPAGRQRAVRWGDLTVGLLDGTSTYATRATEHFVMFSYGGTESPATNPATTALATDAGISLDATVAEVRRAYGDDVEVVPGDELVEPRVRVELDAPHPLVLRTSGDQVTSILAGEPCG